MIALRDETSRGPWPAIGGSTGARFGAFCLISPSRVWLANILMIGRVGFIPMLRWVGISIFTVGQYPMIGWLYFHCHLMFPWCAWLINQIIVGVIASIRLFQPHHCWWTSDSLRFTWKLGTKNILTALAAVRYFNWLHILPFYLHPKGRHTVSSREQAPLIL